MIEDLPTKVAYIENPYKSVASIPELLLFTVADFFYWWYVLMPIQVIRVCVRLLTYTTDQLSISLLLDTFFVPWKRDYTFVGHFMGILIRVIYLPIALLIYLLVVNVSIIFIFIWLLLPLTSIFFIIYTPFTKI